MRTSIQTPPKASLECREKIFFSFCDTRQGRSKRIVRDDDLLNSGNFFLRGRGVLGGSVVALVLKVGNVGCPCLRS